MTILEASKILHKDPSWVRAGIIEGWLPIGVATRDGKQITSIKEIKPGKRINYYIFPDRFEKYRKD